MLPSWPKFSNLFWDVSKVPVFTFHQWFIKNRTSHKKNYLHKSSKTASRGFLFIPPCESRDNLEASLQVFLQCVCVGNPIIHLYALRFLTVNVFIPLPSLCHAHLPSLTQRANIVDNGRKDMRSESGWAAGHQLRVCADMRASNQHRDSLSSLSPLATELAFENRHGWTFPQRYILVKVVNC